MADPRFFQRANPLRLDEIATITNITLTGSGITHAARLMHDVCPLDRATNADISFLDNIKYVDTFSSSKAGACFVRGKFAERAPEGMVALVTEDPYRCFALIAQHFYPALPAASGISPQAYIAKTAKIAAGCSIEPGAFIGENAEIGEGCHIGPNAVIHTGVIIGEHTHIGANSSLSHCMIGKHVIIHRGVHIGQDGFGFALGRESHLKVPQLGRVIIEDNVEIGSGTCVDRGTGPDTYIGQAPKSTISCRLAIT